MFTKLHLFSIQIIISRQKLEISLTFLTEQIFKDQQMPLIVLINVTERMI